MSIVGDNIRPGAENRLRSVWWGRKYVALVMAVLITASALGAGLGLGLNLHPHALYVSGSQH
jgi:hypothetical protein